MNEKERIYSKVMDILRCPKCLAELEDDTVENSLICKRNSLHRFLIINGNPTFVRQEEISPQDAIYITSYEEKPQEYIDYLKEYDDLIGVDLRNEFLKVLERVAVKTSSRILDDSTGTGTIIFGFKQVKPDITCEFVGTDLSAGVLGVARQRFAQASMEVPLFHTYYKELPFKNDSFDIVTHFGGINAFHDIRTAFEEWARVLKPEGFLIVVDEGLSPGLRKTERGAQIIKKNGLFGFQPPIKYLPPLVKNIELRWIAKDTFYVISCQKLSSEELQDIKPLPHEISTRLSFYSKRCYPIK